MIAINSKKILIFYSLLLVSHILGCASANYHAETLLNKDNTDIRTEVVSRYVGYVEGDWKEGGKYCDNERTEMVKFFKNNWDHWQHVKSTIAKGEGDDIGVSRTIDRMSVFEVQCEGGWQLLKNGYKPMVATSSSVKVNKFLLRRMNETLHEYEDRLDAYEDSIYKSEHKRRGTLPDDMKRDPASEAEGD
jgi:hypothetical protein